MLDVVLAEETGPVPECYALFQQECVGSVAYAFGSYVNPGVPPVHVGGDARVAAAAFVPAGLIGLTVVLEVAGVVAPPFP